MDLEASEATSSWNCAPENSGTPVPSRSSWKGPGDSLCTEASSWTACLSLSRGIAAPNHPTCALTTHLPSLFFLLKDQITVYFFFREYYKSIVMETHDQIKLKEEISKEKIIAEICEKINSFCIYWLVFPFPIYLFICLIFCLCS